MALELLSQPPFDPDDDSKAGLEDWTALWSVYRARIVALFEDLLERHDNARELVEELQDFCRALDDDGRQWKRFIVSKGADEFYVRNDNGSYERDSVIRSPDGRWTIVGGEDSTTTAKQLLGTLFWWGDLTAIYKAKSYRGAASFIPPKSCDDWW